MLRRPRSTPTCSLCRMSRPAANQQPLHANEGRLQMQRRPARYPRVCASLTNALAVPPRRHSRELEQIGVRQRTLLKERGPDFLGFFSKYRSESEISAHLADLAETYSHVGLLKAATLKSGATAEKRKLKAYSLGKPASVHRMPLSDTSDEGRCLEWSAS